MKKIISITLCVILLVALLVGCSSGRSADTASWDEAPANAVMTSDVRMAVEAPEMAPLAEADWDFVEAADDGMWLYSGVEQEVGGGIAPISGSVPEADMADKIIRTVFAEIETTSFDETINGVNALIRMYNGFIESSTISGVNYAAQFHGWSDFRSAFFTIRIPVQHLETMTGRLDDLGNVLRETSDAVNITPQFFDTQSRLNSLRIQEERLLDMLAQAEDVPDLILIEERLSEVRFQVESLTTTLNTWQSQVDFSTLTLSIWEVEELTERQEVQRTYWQQIADGFFATIRGIGRFFMNLFMWIIVSAPVIIMILVGALIIFLVIRAKIRKCKKKRNEKSEDVDSESNE